MTKKKPKNFDYAELIAEDRNVDMALSFFAETPVKRQAIEVVQAVLQSPEVQAWKQNAELYQKLRNICVTSTDFTGVMQPDDPERWCVLRRKNGVISSFSCDDLDYGISAAMEQQL